MNAYSEINLYKECKILPDRNFCVDDIEDYLATLTQWNVGGSQSQYIKNQLKQTHKLSLGESYLSFTDTANYNYMKVKNYYRLGPSPTPYSTSVVYYFITNKKWISQDCIELELEMDVINSFNNGIQLSDRTTILRQHKNRWGAGSDIGLYKPLIDLYSEDIKPLLFKTHEYTLYEAEDDDFISGSFYLIYRSHTDDEDSPIDILLCGDSPIEVNVGTAMGYFGLIKYKDLDNRATYGGDMIIYAGDSPSNTGATLEFDVWTSSKNKIRKSWSLTANNQAVYLSSKYVAKGIITLSGFLVQESITYKAFTNKEFNNFDFVGLSGVKCIRQVASGTSLSSLTASTIGTLHKASKIENYLGTTDTMASIGDIDRTDQRLLKIIKLPYRPVQYTIFNGQMINLPSGWIFEDDLKYADNTDFPHMLRYVNSDTTKALWNTIQFTSDDDNFVSPFEVAKNNSLTYYGKRIAKSSELETKLLHSDFFQQRFVYDSFDFAYNLEYLDTSDLGSQVLYVDFYITLTMNSKFMFVQTAYKNFLVIDTQNYSGITYIARNNELPIFNSAYLNYIRTGYNYDIKTRNRQLTSNVIGGALALAGAIGSFASSVYTGGVGVVGGISLATTGISKIYGTIRDTAQADQNIAEKLKTTELEGISVLGSDDVDLMTEYTYDNKAKIVVYEASEKMKKCLFDLFYYFGYVANYQGVPDTTSRKVFNFVQADIVFSMTPNLTKEITNEIVARYKEGITFLHHYTLKDGNNEDVRGWDFEQQYENWEETI